MEVINLSALWLLDLICKTEVAFASLLWRNNLGVVHVDLVNSVVELSALQVKTVLLTHSVI
jgi:hypothetical protein